MTVDLPIPERAFTAAADLRVDELLTERTL
jgi:hypothetical protein